MVNATVLLQEVTHGESSLEIKNSDTNMVRKLSTNHQIMFEKQFPRAADYQPPAATQNMPDSSPLSAALSAIERTLNQQQNETETPTTTEKEQETQDPNVRKEPSTSPPKKVRRSIRANAGMRTNLDDFLEATSPSASTVQSMSALDSNQCQVCGGIHKASDEINSDWIGCSNRTLCNYWVHLVCIGLEVKNLDM